MEGSNIQILHRFLKKSIISGFGMGFRVRTSDLLMVLIMVGSVAVSRGKKALSLVLSEEDWAYER